MKLLTPTQQLKANHYAAIAKLEKRGVTFPRHQGADAVAKAICEHMYWAPGETAAVLERFLNHKPGKVATPRSMRFKPMQGPSLEMQRAYERSERQPKLMSMNSKEGSK